VFDIFSICNAAIASGDTTTVAMTSFTANSISFVIYSTTFVAAVNVTMAAHK